MTERALVKGISPPILRSSVQIGVGAVVYILLFLLGPRLLKDGDVFWHLKVGQQILQTHAFPTIDSFSFTMAGRPWIAKEWLSQVLYAVAFDAAGWTGTVVLASASIALAMALLAGFLLDELALVPALCFVAIAQMLAAPHMIARPHALALPMMVLWTATLIRSIDRAKGPTFGLLPLMVVWANLHGSFLFGLAIAIPLAIEATIHAERGHRTRTVVRWAAFALCATIASCLTPYGPGTLVAAFNVIGLGDALSGISEWRPQDFSKPQPLEFALYLGIGIALSRGIKIPPVRLVTLLGLLHMALAHVRYTEVLAFVGPMLLARPIRRQSDEEVTQSWKPEGPQFAMVSTAALAVAVAVSVVVGSFRDIRPAPEIFPQSPVAVLTSSHVQRVLNDYAFGGYLIYSGVPTFIDSRAELYGSRFIKRVGYAVSLRNMPDFLRLLDEYQIGATVLSSDTPAIALLDTRPEWRRIYADDDAVVHIRTADVGPASARPTSSEYTARSGP